LTFLENNNRASLSSMHNSHSQWQQWSRHFDAVYSHLQYNFPTCSPCSSWVSPSTGSI